MAQSTNRGIEDEERHIVQRAGEDWNTTKARTYIALRVLEMKRGITEANEQLEADRRVHRLVEAALAKRIADGR